MRIDSRLSYTLVRQLVLAPGQMSLVRVGIHLDDPLAGDNEPVVLCADGCSRTGRSLVIADLVGLVVDLPKANAISWASDGQPRAIELPQVGLLLCLLPDAWLILPCVGHADPHTRVVLSIESLDCIESALI